MIVACSKCGKKLKVAEALRGKSVKCPCGAQLRIAAAAKSSSPAESSPQKPVRDNKPVDLGDLSNIPPASPQFSGGYNPYAQPTPAPQGSTPKNNASEPSGLAITSMVFGILAWVSCGCSLGLLSLAAIICGHIALSKVNKGEAGGKGFAVAGLATGYSALLPAIFWILYMIFYGIVAVLVLFGAAANA